MPFASLVSSNNISLLQLSPVNDNGPIINSALLAGAEILLPPGVYPFSTPIVNNGGRLLGAGKDLTTLRWVGGPGTGVVFCGNAPNSRAHLGSLTVDCNNVASQNGIVGQSIVYSIWRDIHVKNCTNAAFIFYANQVGGVAPYNNNLACNQFYGLSVDTSFYGMYISGFNGQGGVVDNHWFGTQLFNITGVAVAINDLADDNQWYGVEFLLNANNAIGVSHNVANAAAGRVYSNNFYGVTGDPGPGPTQTFVVMQNTAGNKMTSCYASGFSTFLNEGAGVGSYELERIDTTPSQYYRKGIAQGGSIAGLGAIVTGSTITPIGGGATIAPIAAVTGLIMTAGAIDGQEFYIYNNSAFAATFAAVGISHVLGGPVMAANTLYVFRWIAALGAWAMK